MTPNDWWVLFQTLPFEVTQKDYLSFGDAYGISWNLAVTTYFSFLSMLSPSPFCTGKDSSTLPRSLPTMQISMSAFASWQLPTRTAGESDAYESFAMESDVLHPGNNGYWWQKYIDRILKAQEPQKLERTNHLQSHSKKFTPPQVGCVQLSWYSNGRRKYSILSTLTPTCL